MVIFLEGKSGSGKDTLANKILEDFDIERRVLYTTRPKRDNEEDGVDYFFVSEYEFDRMVKNGEFLEYRYYYTAYGKWYYGTPRGDLTKDILIWGPSSMYVVILDSLSKLGLESSLKCIYVDICGWVRLSRMVSRSSIIKDREEREHFIAEVARRYIADEEDFNTIDLLSCDLVVDNSGRLPISQVKSFLKDCGVKLRNRK